MKYPQRYRTQVESFTGRITDDALTVLERTVLERNRHVAVGLPSGVATFHDTKGKAEEWIVRRVKAGDDMRGEVLKVDVID